VLDKVTDFLLFLGKLLIAGSVGECWRVVVVRFVCYIRLFNINSESMFTFSTAVFLPFLFSHKNNKKKF